METFTYPGCVCSTGSEWDRVSYKSRIKVQREATRKERDSLSSRAKMHRHGEEMEFCKGQQTLEKQDVNTGKQERQGMHPHHNYGRL